MIFRWLKRRRRQRLLDQPFPEEWRELVGTNLWQYRCLSASDQGRLREMLRVLVAEKNWEGCRGQIVTDEVKVTIAAQVALLLLGLDQDSFESVLSVLIYPEAYLAREIDTSVSGVVVERESPREGEAWYGGPVVLSWDECLDGGRDSNAGHNLVIHEFAHQLDMLNGRAADGIPPIGSRREVEKWRNVMNAEYSQLVQSCRRRRPTLLDCYGTKDLSEFFAVASEVFFQNPWSLKRVHPELYAVLRDYYGQDPAGWDETIFASDG